MGGGCGRNDAADTGREQSGYAGTDRLTGMWKHVFILLIAPLILVRHRILTIRKYRAVQRAEKRSRQYGRDVHVVQIGRRFTIGTREELRRMNRTGRKNLRRLYLSRLFDFDYRNSIVYTAKC
jgi:hypothetical protein